MDYNSSSTEMIFPHWKQINDPKFKLYAFQGQEQGEIFDKFIQDFEEIIRETVIEKKNIGYIEIDSIIANQGILKTAPPVKGEYIGQIKIGKESKPTYYIWTGEIWSKIIDNQDGTYSAKAYSKISGEISQEIKWNKNESLKEISNKFLFAKNSANFVEGFRELWPAFEIVLSLGAIAPEASFHRSNFTFKVYKKIKSKPKTETAYDIAKNRGKYHNFYLQYLEKSIPEIQKGIRSFQKQINNHKDKIKNPEKYISNFKKLDIRQQRALINEKWPSDIKRQEEQLEILRQILKTKK